MRNRAVTLKSKAGQRIIVVSFELDHVFIGTGAGAPEADALVEFGLREGEPNTHPGQGTANRRFFFENMMLELVWVDNERDAKSPLAKRLHTWERWKGRRGEASPFGVCLRPADLTTQTLPFAGWAYRPPYFAPRFIHIGKNSASIHEPLICFQSLPADARAFRAACRISAGHRIEDLQSFRC